MYAWNMTMHGDNVVAYDVDDNWDVVVYDVNDDLSVRM